MERNHQEGAISLMECDERPTWDTIFQLVLSPMKSAYYDFYNVQKPFPITYVDEQKNEKYDMAYVHLKWVKMLVPKLIKLAVFSQDL